MALWNRSLLELPQTRVIHYHEASFKQGNFHHKNTLKTHQAPLTEKLQSSYHSLWLLFGFSPQPLHLNHYRSLPQHTVYITGLCSLAASQTCPIILPPPPLSQKIYSDSYHSGGSCCYSLSVWIIPSCRPTCSLEKVLKYTAVAYSSCRRFKARW